MALFENIWLVLWKVKSTVEINSRISKTFLVLNGLSWRDELRICTAILMNVECLQPDFVVIYGQARLICGWPKPKSATSSFIMRLGCWISDDVGWHHLGPMKPCLVLLASRKEVRAEPVLLMHSAQWNVSKKAPFIKLGVLVLLYEAKVPTSDWCSAVWKCSHAIEQQRHWYHTSALSNEVCNFVFAQGARKLSAKIKM